MALTKRQQIFVDEYLTSFNATQAAIVAGYSERTAYAQGHALLKHIEIAPVVSQRLRETAMSADEVLMRLGRHARSNVADFTDEDGKLDWQKARKLKKLDLVKEFTQREVTKVSADGKVTTTVKTTNVKLHDPQKALELLAKNHRLLVDRVDQTGEVRLLVEYVEPEE